MSVDGAAVLVEMGSWVGWREGPGNQNPFGPYQGVGDGQPYCESFADGVPHQCCGYDHSVGLTMSKTQFGPKGDAYTPWGVNHAIERGEWMADHASAGRPADLAPLDQVFFAWNNGAGPEPDHVETVIAVYADGTFDTIGANTGSPNGVWVVRRDRKYLLGRRRPHLYAAPAPEPAPNQEDSLFVFDMPGHGTGVWITDGFRRRQTNDPNPYLNNGAKHLGTLTEGQFNELADDRPDNAILEELLSIVRALSNGPVDPEVITDAIANGLAGRLVRARAEEG